MKINHIILISTIVSLFFVSSCDIAGGGDPDKYGMAFMIKNKFPESTRDAVINKTKMDDKLVIELSKSKSSDVRFLVGSNPNLTVEQLNIFIKDSDDFTRSGVAINPSISIEQMKILENDSSHTVYAQLAGNPSVPENILMRLYTVKELDPLWLVMNPNCPESIKTSVRKSDNKAAIQWLKTTEDWKKSGFFIKDHNGRWGKK